MSPEPAVIKSSIGSHPTGFNIVTTAIWIQDGAERSLVGHETGPSRNWPVNLLARFQILLRG